MDSQGCPRDSTKSLLVPWAAYKKKRYMNKVYISFLLQVEMAQYEKGVQWLKEALFRSQFVAQRVRVKANKLINSIGDRKRSGPKLLDLMFHNIVFKNGESQSYRVCL